jgi:hypothetical protein
MVAADGGAPAGGSRNDPILSTVMPVPMPAVSADWLARLAWYRKSPANEVDKLGDCEIWNPPHYFRGMLEENCPKTTAMPELSVKMNFCLAVRSYEGKQ